MTALSSPEQEVLFWTLALLVGCGVALIWIAQER
jgi:hypothetical protein